MNSPLLPERIDLPHVVAEVSDHFHQYEAALMANDVEALDNFFWRDARVTRYGIGDRQWGHEALAEWRRSVPPPDFTRTLQHLRITAFGEHLAVAQVEFVRSDTALRGFQTQTWALLPEGWKIVAAHVSMIDLPA